MRLRSDYETAISNNENPDDTPPADSEQQWLEVNDVNRLQAVVAPLSPEDQGERVQHLQLALAWLDYAIDYNEYRDATFGESTRCGAGQLSERQCLSGVWRTSTKLMPLI